MTHLPRHSSDRGFTLIELLVALLAGMIVTGSAFAFAKAATNSFQQETRSAAATVAGAVGFRRLVADMQRAGFLSTPNIQRDYVYGGVAGSVCVQPSSAAGYASGIQNLASLSVEQGGAYSPSDGQNHNDAANGLSPDRITIAGSMTSTEQFPIRTIVVNGGNTDIFLQPASGAALRTWGTAAKTDVTPWTNIFAPGRILRVVDQLGYQYFGVIAATSLSSPGQPMIRLGLPALFMQGGTASGPTNPGCSGINGLAVGALANVVNRIRYEIRDLRGVASYNSIYATSTLGVSSPVEDATGNRFELVRYEIDTNNNSINNPETRELIAEYAVDLKLGLTVDSRVSGVTPPVPVLQKFDPGQPQVYNWTTLATIPSGTAGPERIRSVQIRLMVRSRQADRSSALAGPTLGSGVSGGLYRYRIPGTTNRYARVRTFQSDIVLANQLGEIF